MDPLYNILKEFCLSDGKHNERIFMGPSMTKILKKENLYTFYLSSVEKYAWYCFWSDSDHFLRKQKNRRLWSNCFQFMQKFLHDDILDNLFFQKAGKFNWWKRWTFSSRSEVLWSKVTRFLKKYVRRLLPVHVNRNWYKTLQTNDQSVFFDLLGKNYVKNVE